MTAHDIVRLDVVVPSTRKIGIRVGLTPATFAINMTNRAFDEAYLAAMAARAGCTDVESTEREIDDDAAAAAEGMDAAERDEAELERYIADPIYFFRKKPRAYIYGVSELDFRWTNDNEQVVINHVRRAPTKGQTKKAAAAAAAAETKQKAKRKRPSTGRRVGRPSKKQAAVADDAGETAKRKESAKQAAKKKKKRAIVDDDDDDDGEGDDENSNGGGGGGKSGVRPQTALKAARLAAALNAAGIAEPHKWIDVVFPTVTLRRPKARRTDDTSNPDQFDAKQRNPSARVCPLFMLPYLLALEYYYNAGNDWLPACIGLYRAVVASNARTPPSAVRLRDAADSDREDCIKQLWATLARMAPASLKNAPTPPIAPIDDDDKAGEEEEPAPRLDAAQREMLFPTVDEMDGGSDDDEASSPAMDSSADEAAAPKATAETPEVVVDDEEGDEEEAAERGVDDLIDDLM